MKDFRQITFETLFEEGLTSLKEKDFNISSLSENQNLRANQLFNNTRINYFNIGYFRINYGFITNKSYYLRMGKACR